MTTAAHELETRTREYWDLSMTWNGIIALGITVEDAFEVTGNSLARLDPNRPLAKRIRQLRQDIISYGDEEGESAAEEALHV